MDKNLRPLLFGIGIGAALMYILDPDRGGRRRALARDKVIGASNTAGMYLGKAGRDLRNRAQGVVAETRNRFSSEEVPDDVLVDRVKAHLGRFPVHHRALEITASQGRVTLRGPALANEVDDLLKAVSEVRGVKDVDNRLEIHEEAGSISSLQGEVASAQSAGRS